jgi:hypothetical protein
LQLALPTITVTNRLTGVVWTWPTASKNGGICDGKTRKRDGSKEGARERDSVQAGSVLIVDRVQHSRGAGGGANRRLGEEI